MKCSTWNYSFPFRLLELPSRLLDRQQSLHAHDAVATSQWQWDFSCAA